MDVCWLLSIPSVISEGQKTLPNPDRAPLHHAAGSVPASPHSGGCTCFIYNLLPPIKFLEVEQLYQKWNLGITLCL